MKKSKTEDIKLSICIPIFNGGNFIEDTLESIIKQISSDTEIVVYDGGSNDNTKEILNNYEVRYDNFSYFRSEIRGGIDVDLETCISYAKGKYCWLFSGDDMMRPYALDRAFLYLKKNFDVYIFQHTLCDLSMNIKMNYPVFFPDVEIATNLQDANSRRFWFKHAITTEAFFSFLSSIIIKRSIWNKGNMIEKFRGSCWGHVARIFELTNDELNVLYIPEIWLDKRGENDSFSGNGITNRYKIAIQGYNEIANYFFGDNSFEAYHIRRVLRNEFTLRMFISAKFNCKIFPDTEDMNTLDYIVKLAYSDISIMNIIKYNIYKYIPLKAYSIIKTIYKRIFE